MESGGDERGREELFSLILFIPSFVPINLTVAGHVNETAPHALNLN